MNKTIVFGLLAMAPGAALGQSAPAAPPPATELAPPATLLLPEVNVVGSSPLLGSGVDRNKVPAETNVLTSGDISRSGTPNALRALNEDVPGVTLDNSQGNPYQPNLLYHGYEASPLQGNSQGLAVYLNGVRFNSPFGDTVNWDLIPSIAIDTTNLEGANPVFGLNALGGSLSVQMKNGFTYQGAEATVWGGSFGHIETDLQYGKKIGNTSVYLAGTALHDDGYRDFQSSDIYNFYGDVGWRSDRAEVHLNIDAANNVLNGPATSPVQLIAIDPALPFTLPNVIANKYILTSLSGNLDITDTTSIQANAYYDYFLQRVVNGNATNFSPCNDGTGFLCESPGVFATDRAGNPIPDFRNGGPYSQLDLQTTNTNGYGASAQVTNRNDIFGFRNHVVAGLSFDGSNTLFDGATALGGLTLDTRDFIGPGVIVNQADGSNTPVRVSITDAYYGIFLTDTLELTSRLSLNVAGRFNIAEIDLQDQGGGALTGNHNYERFNPAIGLTYKITPNITAYAGYSESNRAPTPAELSCASAASPCSLSNFFVGDPDLKQVVGHTVEAGLRGHFRAFSDAKLAWNVSLFRSDLNDDILFVNSPIQGRAFFENVGSTRRQGVDIGGRLDIGRWFATLDYSYTDATFQTPFTASSQDNPAADANGNINIRPGDRLPGIPAHLLKLGLNFRATDSWTIGANAIAASGRVLFGDEANLTPHTPPYFVLDLHTSYQVTPHVQLFGQIENAFNEQYYTFGTFSPVASVPITQLPGGVATNTRAYSPASPIAGYGGIRVTF